MTSSTVSNPIWGRQVKLLWHKDELQRQLRLHRSAGRIFLRRLSALRRHGALFADHARRGEICPERRTGAGDLQWLSDSLRVRVCCPARWCAMPACSLSASRFICASKKPTRRLQRGLKKGQLLRMPVKHGEGCYYADAENPRALAQKSSNPAALRRCKRQDRRRRPIPTVRWKISRVFATKGAMSLA